MFCQVNPFIQTNQTNIKVSWEHNQMSKFWRFITDRDVQINDAFYSLMYPAVDKILLSTMYHYYLKKMDTLHNVIG